jgi:hypothetical protein
MQLLYKLLDFVFKIPPGSRHWPSPMHKPHFVGDSLTLLTRDPWSLQRMPLLVELERQLHQVLCSSEEAGEDILRQLLQTPRQLASVPEDVAHQMLQVSGPRQVLGEENSRQGRKLLV